MKVSELIALLQKEDGDSKIYIWVPRPRNDWRIYQGEFKVDSATLSKTTRILIPRSEE